MPFGKITKKVDIYFLEKLKFQYIYTDLVTTVARSVCLFSHVCPAIFLNSRVFCLKNSPKTRKITKIFSQKNTKNISLFILSFLSLQSKI